MKKVTMADIARRCGVSIQHVSRTLAGMKGVSANTGKRILEAARTMGYLDTPHKKRIAVLTVLEPDDWNIPCLEILEEFGLQGVLFQSQDFSPDYEPFFDGAIIQNVQNQIGSLWYSKYRLPVISINQYGDIPERIPCIMPNADDEMKKAVLLLYRNGHRKIARLHPTTLSAQEKYRNRGTRGFMEAIDDLGIGDLARNVDYEPADQVVKVLPKLLKEGFTAFISVADPNHERLLKTFRKAQKRIPEDISLIVYNIDPPFNPELTAFEINNGEIIREGVKLLLDKISGKEVPMQTIIPTPLHLARSVGKVRP